MPVEKKAKKFMSSRYKTHKNCVKNIEPSFSKRQIVSQQTKKTAIRKPVELQKSNKRNKVFW